MRLLIVNPLWPHSQHSIRAANVVIFEILREMARHPDVKLGFLKLDRDGEAGPTEVERQAIADMQALGIEVLEPWRMPKLPPSPPLRRKLLGTRLDHYYPETVHAASAHAAAAAFKPDLLFIPWSEWATALFAHMTVKKFAYYGNPDPKAVRVRSDFERAHGGGLVDYLAEKVYAARLEKVHLRLMRQYDYLGNVAANDAQYYRDRGFPDCFYIQNLWMDRFPGAPPALAAGRPEPEVPVIIGSIGKLAGTANTHGLELLGRDILPALERRMGGRPYEVHLLGSGQMHPAVRPLFDRPEVRLRGFVDDIDMEMAGAAAFLCANNGSAYNVGHTRYLHAWSLGCCVVAHQAASVAMPEIQDGQNALLGRTSDDVAARLVQAVTDADLRRRMGQAGYDTFRRDFVAGRVVPRILGRIGLS